MVVSITGRDLLLKLGVASCRLHNDCPGKTSWRYNAWRCCYGALAGIWFSRHPRAGSQVYWTKVQYTSFNSPVYASILKLPIAYRRTYRFGAPANQTMTVFQGCLNSPARVVVGSRFSPLKLPRIRGTGRAQNSFLPHEKRGDAGQCVDGNDELRANRASLRSGGRNGGTRTRKFLISKATAKFHS